MEGLEQIYSLYKEQKASADFHYSFVLNSLLKFAPILIVFYYRFNLSISINVVATVAQSV